MPSDSGPPRGAKRPFVQYVRIAAWQLLPWVILFFIAAAVGLGLYGGILRRLAQVRAEREQATAARTDAAADVEVWPVEPALLVDDMQLPGVVRPWEELVLEAQVSGQIMSFAFDDGDEVQAGEVIAQIDDRDYQAALARAHAAEARSQANLSAAKADEANARAAQARAQAVLRLARLDYDRARSLQQEGAATRARLDQAKSSLDQAQADLHAAEAAVARAQAAKAQAQAGLLEAQSAITTAQLQVERCSIEAPFAGIVNRRFITVGTLVKSGARVLELLDLHKVKVEIAIPEADVDAVRDLDTAPVRVRSLGRTFAGRKTFLSLKPIEQAQVFHLRLVVDNPDRLLRPGMFAEATVVRSRTKDAVVVPMYAILARDDAHVVFVVEDGKAVKRPVRLGIRQGRTVQVVDGLQPGEKLITMGQRQVEDGQPVDVLRTAADPTERLQ